MWVCNRLIHKQLDAEKSEVMAFSDVAASSYGDVAVMQALATHEIHSTVVRAIAQYDDAIFSLFPELK